jgi:hypothetical protein
LRLLGALTQARNVVPQGAVDRLGPSAYIAGNRGLKTA